MRYVVDPDLCNGHGRCHTFYSDVYSSDDEGLAKDRGQLHLVPPGLEDRARGGASICPEGAIRIVED